MPLVALADTGLPPPAVHKTTDNAFPSSQALKQQGYNPQTGVLKVEPRKQGSPTITSNGQIVTGRQNVDVVVTDKYGNKVKVPSRITQTVGTGSVVVLASNTIGNSIKKASEDFGSELSNNLNNGDYYGAFLNSARIVGGAIDNTFTGGFLGDAFGSYGSENAKRTADRLINSLYGGGPGTGTPSTGNPSSPSTGNPSSPSTGTPTSPGNPSNPSSGGGGSSSGLGSAANAAGSAQRTAEKNGDVSGATGNAAFKKAADSAKNAAKLKEDYERARERLNKGDVVWVLTKTIESIHPSGYGYVIKQSAVRYTDKIPASTLGASVGFDGYGKLTAISGDPELMSMLPRSASKGVILIRLNWSRLDFNYKHKSDIAPSDMTLTAEEIKQILQRMFASQQTNHREMMNQLSKIAANTAPNKSTSTSTETTPPSTTGSQVIRGGDSVVDAATTSRTIEGSTVISAPYTPSGSSQAQQTSVTLHSDGTVTTSIIPRPDLKANSSQAPTRSPVVSESATPSLPGETAPSPTSPSPTVPDPANPSQNNPSIPSSQQNQQQRDFCQQNPSAAQCADLGNADYEDLDIPENAIDLKLEPLDIFSTDGTCPANPSVSFGALGELEIDYEYFCGVARMIRPILILGIIIMCGFFAYNAVKEV